MELPNYKIPSLKRACFSMLERAKAYIKKAATIILVCNCVVQLMQTFNWHFQVVAEGAEDTSILATIASPFAVLPVSYTHLLRTADWWKRWNCRSILIM